jgi:PCI domain
LQQLAGTSASPTFELLRLFAFGTWSDYKSSDVLKAQPLSEAQATKLKKLTIVSLASQSKTLAYDVLMRELEMSSVREVEDLLIECIYGGLLQGRLDQAAGQLDVFSCSARDVNPKELASMSESLLQVRPGSGCPVCAPDPTHRCVAPAPHSQWHSGAVQLMASVSEELGRFKQHQEDARTWQEDLDAKVSAVKVTLRSSQDAGDGTFGASELSSMEYDDDKMRKSGRFKARGKQSAR